MVTVILTHKQMKRFHKRSHNGLGSHNCSHSEDVNVRCSGSKTGSLFKLKIFSDLFDIFIQEVVLMVMFI